MQRGAGKSDETVGRDSGQFSRNGKPKETDRRFTINLL